MKIFGIFTGDFFLTMLAVLSGLWVWNSFFAAA